MGDLFTAALSEAAQTLHDQARANKRAEQTHRRQAREAAQQRDRLIAAAAAHGIRIHIETTTATGGHRHG